MHKRLLVKGFKLTGSSFINYISHLIYLKFISNLAEWKCTNSIFPLTLESRMPSPEEETVRSNESQEYLMHAPDKLVSKFMFNIMMLKSTSRSDMIQSSQNHRFQRIRIIIMQLNRLLHNLAVGIDLDYFYLNFPFLHSNI